MQLFQLHLEILGDLLVGIPAEPILRQEQLRLIPGVAHDLLCQRDCRRFVSTNGIALREWTAKIQHPDRRLRLRVKIIANDGLAIHQEADRPDHASVGKRPMLLIYREILIDRIAVRGHGKARIPQELQRKGRRHRADIQNAQYLPCFQGGKARGRIRHTDEPDVFASRCFPVIASEPPQQYPLPRLSVDDLKRAGSHRIAGKIAALHIEALRAEHRRRKIDHPIDQHGLRSVEAQLHLIFAELSDPLIAGVDTGQEKSVKRRCSIPHAFPTPVIRYYCVRVKRLAVLKQNSLPQQKSPAGAVLITLPAFRQTASNRPVVIRLYQGFPDLGNAADVVRILFPGRQIPRRCQDDLSGVFRRSHRPHTGGENQQKDKRRPPQPDTFSQEKLPPPHTPHHLPSHHSQPIR